MNAKTVITIKVYNYVQNAVIIVILAMDPVNMTVFHVISQILEIFYLIMHVSALHIISIPLQSSVHNAFIVVIHVPVKNIINVYHVMLIVSVLL